MKRTTAAALFALTCALNPTLAAASEDFGFTMAHPLLADEISQVQVIQEGAQVRLSFFGMIFTLPNLVVDGEYVSIVLSGDYKFVFATMGADGNLVSLRDGSKATLISKNDNGWKVTGLRFDFASVHVDAMGDFSYVLVLPPV